MHVMHLLSRLFELEEINGGERCPTYLYRWLLLKTRWFNVYLHRFVADDWSLDLHDHPKRFISVGLWGSYVEETPFGYPAARLGSTYRVFTAPWVRTFPAEHVHRISLLDGECWTLVVVLRSVRPWGFWHRGEWIHWRRYVASEAADARKACQ